MICKLNEFQYQFSGNNIQSRNPDDVKNMRAEQQLMRDVVEAQAEEQKMMRATLDRLNKSLERKY